MDETSYEAAPEDLPTTETSPIEIEIEITEDEVPFHIPRD